MTGLQRDQDFGVGRSDCPAVAVGKVDAAGRQTDVVENARELRGRDVLANDAFNLIGEGGGRFDPGAGLRPHMQTNLARVNRREEVLAEEWNERKAREAKDQKAEREKAAVLQTEAQHARVPFPQHVEAALETVVNAREHAGPLLRLRVLPPLHFSAQQIHDERRDERSREEI